MKKAIALLLFVAAFTLLTGSSSFALTAPPATGVQPDLSLQEPAPAQVTAAAGVQLNEILVSPPEGQHQWVELRRTGAGGGHVLYLPLLFKDFTPGAVADEPASAFAPAAATNPDISGWQVSNQSGGNYTIPAALPPVPPGAFVLIYFDGQGPAADDTSFGDGVAVLHTPSNLVDIFTRAADQVALYNQAAHNPQTIVDFLAYGAAPGEAANDAIAAGLWKAQWWLEFFVGAGARDASAPLPTNRSTGLYPGHANRSPNDWAVYLAADQTPGAANPVPRAVWSTVADGAAMGSDGFALGWMYVPGAKYQLQIDNDGAFGSPLVDTVLDQPYYQPQTPPPGGLWHWRVRAIIGQQPAAWSTPLTVKVVPVAGFMAPGDTAEAIPASPAVELSMTWLRQRKDNKLLCLDGDDEGDPATSGLEVAWDAVHTDGIYTHGQNSCVRAAIAMIVTHYGGNLSMDRIGYRQFENWGSPLADIGEKNNPLRDLGHDRTTAVCGGDGADGGVLLSWALGGAGFDYDYAKPTFNQVKGWIDAGRPVMRFHGTHQTVIGGYRTLADSTQQIRLFDPWSGTTWETYSTLNITCYYVPVASAPGVRSDEPSIWTDADGDGIMDWDEQNRFHTMPTYADSDDDWVPDKADIREYVFNTGGTYNLRGANPDGDAQRKELDADNDGDGAADGCEDANRNGKYEPALGETDNFNAASHQACTPIFEILQPLQTNPANAGAHDAPDKIIVQVKTATPPSSPVTYTAGDFQVRIGGQDSPVLAAYQALDTHFLVVSAHTQPAADYYDLEVSLGGQTDSETRAVFYLPRLRADQVLVIDRSGSMADYDKLAAAKNAARAFIDHSNVGDMVGVVSFETTAAVNYPLTNITGDPEWNAAKAAVNALVTGNTTALGTGARLGYDQLVASGKADHDWSLALLSDGMENVAPNWSDATVSGVIVPSRAVVHTVALGRDADTTLLNNIAAETGGQPYEAGVDILPSPAPALELAAAPAAGPYGPNVPNTLPNRLADVYKAIGETNGHQQRVWEKTGYLCEKPIVFELPVEKGLPEAIFTTNWDNRGAYIDMKLTDPKGNLIKHSPPAVRELRDATHHQFRVQDPLGGVWKVELTGKGCANYLFIMSARSETTLHLGFGLPPAERTVGAKLPILAVLADEKPIAGAEVWALVQGPNSDLVQTLQLFDDGGHADGKGGDGVYGNFFTKLLLPGQYLVKATASGKNNSGEFVVRHATAGFTVLPRVAYVWLNDLPTAVAYQALVQARGYVVTLVPMADVATTQWSRYELILIGPDTGDGANWGDPRAVGALQQYTTPIIGLGEGGYAFFGKVDPVIGHPNGWHGNEIATYAMDPLNDVWHSPYAIPLGRERTVKVYGKTAHVGIQVLKPVTDMVLIGREPGDQTHYNVLQHTKRYLLWGFQGWPRAMTLEGRHLFMNVVRRMAGM